MEHTRHALLTRKEQRGEGVSILNDHIEQMDTHSDPAVDVLRWTDEKDGSFAIETTKRNAYPIAIGRGKLSSLPDVLAKFPEADSVFVVTDDHVSALYLDATVSMIRGAGLSVQFSVIPHGECSKTWRVAEQLLASLAQGRAKRRTILVALGGGVLCDLVGFVASTFMRGVPYVNLPTTLMAQLDAAIGGKTGIDFNGSKNLVGAFYHPSAVIVDPDVLATLPAREIRNGMAEAIKVGILYPELFSRIETLRPTWNGDVSDMESIVRCAIVGKLQFLKDDPYERSLMRMLNLGHTVGHALEAATDFAHFRHGEAVAIGIAIAVQVSQRLEFCHPHITERILNCLKNCGLPVSLPSEYAASTWKELDVIRRIRNGKLNEVLPMDIGRCLIVDEVTIDDYKYAARSLDLASRT